MPIRRSKTGEPILNPAALRNPITFLDQTTTLGVAGQVTAWAPADPPDVTLAEIVATRGSDLLRSGLDVSLTYATVTIRYNPDVPRSSGDRFQDAKGRQWVIKSFLDIDPGREKYQELMCQLIGQS